MKDATEEMRCVQAENTRVVNENAQLHKEMITLLKGKIDTRHLEDINSDVKEDHEIAENYNLNRSYNNMNVKTRPFRCKPTRPKIEAEVDDLGWQIFEDAWARYKKISELEDEGEAFLELRECCSSDVNKLLYEFMGNDELNANTLTEEKLLGYIKSVAVKTIHSEVHRWHFDQKTQESGESITRCVVG